MTGFAAEAVYIYPKRAHSHFPTILVGDFENNSLIRGSAKPGVFGDLAFQLPSTPAGIAKCDHDMFRTLSAGDSRENVARGRDSNVAAYRLNRIPLARGAVNDEPAFALDRAPLTHAYAIKFWIGGGNIHVPKHFAQIQIQWAVYHQSHRAFLVVCT